MEFKRVDPDCTFSIPDVVTVRQQLAYYSSFPATLGQDFFERRWLGARALITSWDCPAFPDKDADLDAVSDPIIPLILAWAGTQVKNHIDGLKSVPKN